MAHDRSPGIADRSEDETAPRARQAPGYSSETSPFPTATSGSRTRTRRYVAGSREDLALQPTASIEPGRDPAHEFPVHLLCALRRIRRTRRSRERSTPHFGV